MKANISFKGNKKKYEVLLTVDKDDNDKLIIYTDNKKDKDGFICAYAGKYTENEVLGANEEDMILLENILNSLEKE